MEQKIVRTNKQKLLTDVQKKYMKTSLPPLRSGDYVAVYNKIIENNKYRIQRFEGVVLKVRGSNLSKTMIVRKDSNVSSIERTFQLHSPLIEKIEIIRQGKVRRAYLTYLRKRSAKAARIKERKPKISIVANPKPTALKNANSLTKQEVVLENTQKQDTTKTLIDHALKKAKTTK